MCVFVSHGPCVCITTCCCGPTVSHSLCARVPSSCAQALIFSSFYSVAPCACLPRSLPDLVQCIPTPPLRSQVERCVCAVPAARNANPTRLRAGAFDVVWPSHALSCLHGPRCLPDPHGHLSREALVGLFRCSARCPDLHGQYPTLPARHTQWDMGGGVDCEGSHRQLPPHTHTCRTRTCCRGRGRARGRCCAPHRRVSSFPCRTSPASNAGCL